MKKGNKLAKIRDYLWQPYELSSRRKPAAVQKEISEQLIREPFFHWLPYYGEAAGEVKNGRFIIRYTPMPTILIRGTGTMEMTGRVEAYGKGSRIYGRLLGPTAAICFLAAVSVVALGFTLGLWISDFMGHRSRPELPIPAAFTVVTGLMATMKFFFDREINKEGEDRIMEILKNAAG